MKIDVFTTDNMYYQCVGGTVVRALKAMGHDAHLEWHPTTMREDVELTFDIGGRIVDHNIGVPVVHYITEPIAQVPEAWIQATVRGHLFFFADHESYERAHKSGIRMAEYLPFGWDCFAPLHEDVKAEFDVGFFGVPTQEVQDIFLQVLQYNKNWKIAVWGPKDDWQNTGFGASWAGTIPDSNTLFKEINRCRHVLADPRHKRPDYFFMQAAASRNAIGIAPFSPDIWECFEQSRFLFVEDNFVSFLNSISGAAWRDTKNNQMSVMGTLDSPKWTRDVQMDYCTPRFNRMLDRMMYWFMLMENKQLLVSARQNCPPQILAKMLMEQDRNFIRIGYPTESMKSPIDVTNSPGIHEAEIPFLLRSAARMIEMQMLDGALLHNVKHFHPSREDQCKSLSSDTKPETA